MQNKFTKWALVHGNRKNTDKLKKDLLVSWREHVICKVQRSQQLFEELHKDAQLCSVRGHVWKEETLTSKCPSFYQAFIY